jgi:invasion protein IalB
LKIFFQVPADVSLQAGTKFVFDDKEAGLAAQFRWCIPQRCLADTGLPGLVVNKIRSRTETARVEYKDALQHDISLPVS